MPEGDTVHKIAAQLREAIEERPLRSLWLRERGPVDSLRGAIVRDASAVGKHLVLSFGPPGVDEERWFVHVHLGMYGRWHRYAIDDVPPRWLPQAQLRFAVGDREWVCRRAAHAELLRRSDLETHPAISRLGPDLLDHRLELETIVARARASGERSVSALLLDQRVACGIGNVYRNEILFLEGLRPDVSTLAVSDEGIRRLYRRARLLMRANLGGWRRTTTRRVSREAPLRRGEPRSWVYGRGGRPCLVCRSPVRAGRSGDQARATYWCADCQGAPALPR